ncbi:hypothetical protein IMG5_197410 [Ichthyophthirius multifiliis]|uniref:Small ribosomal subunit protein uS17 n=1 Tax=Ichthyophthirius multifiliis TaxID=5932 RepID=G0R5B1_ICHMU|nr:hypothetical protein IMG5_197410 [Ichthyophthirius multifiliis]EGR27356.1 hypothetical protein IMG5_197410 [Ichthyophthirius multifiliis]|eukprot:XP_004024240.1 hypothetical protein IMG5_197410 [Ichthyophthirius multifiliis]
MENQHERAFQKQDGIFLNSKKVLQKKTAAGVRYYKNIGLGFKTPKEAIDGHYIDKKCPFTSNLSIRGKLIKGLVISTKMNRTVIIRRDYLHYVRNTTDMKKDTETLLSMYPHAFKLKKEIFSCWIMQTYLQNCKIQHSLSLPQ